MKTGWYILTIVIMVIASGLTGYFWAKSEEDSQVIITAAPDREFVARDDSFNRVISGKEDSLELLKSKLSSFSRKPVKAKDIPAGDSLRNDISTFQQIVRTQDTLRQIEGRKMTFIRNELYETNNKLATLQYKYNKDMDRQKRTRVNVFLSGVGVGAGVVLVAVLVL